VDMSGHSNGWARTYSIRANIISEVYVGNPPIDRGARDTGSGMQFVSEYVIGQSGTLVAWEFFTFRSDTVVLQIWRATADEGLEYDLVGSTVVTASSGYNEVDANIEVQSGDVLGWFCTGVQPIVFNSGGETVRRRYGYSGTDQQVDMSGHSNGWARTYSIRANIISGESGDVGLENCSWKSQDTGSTSIGNGVYFGFTCNGNEVMTGFKLHDQADGSINSQNGNPFEIRCCEVFGHSAVTSTCDWSASSGISQSQSWCDATAHKAFSGVYDLLPPTQSVGNDAYTETQARKCCEVVCDEQYCQNGDWGVDAGSCHTLTANYTGAGEHVLTCPTGTLMTKVIDTPNESQIWGVETIHQIECCALDIVPPPTKSPTTCPSADPSLSPSVHPTTAPTTANPTTCPSAYPSLSPSVHPTTAPTTQTDCLLNIDRTNPTVSDDDFLKALKDCIPCFYDMSRRQLALDRLMNAQEVSKM